VTPTADALMFFMNRDRKTGILRLLASDGSTADRLNKTMAASNTWTLLKPSGPGIWEAAIPFSGDEASSERMFIIVGLLGFAVYL
jgi:hypothetical protein